MKRIISLLLLVVLLCGCGATNSLGFHGVVKFSEMEYTRPDLDEFQQIAQSSCDLARTSKDQEAVEDAIWTLYDAIDHYATQADLAYIHYHANLSDIYWQEEYAYCMEQQAEVDAALEDLYEALAQSPIRDIWEREESFGPGFFDAYEGGGMYDETLMAYLEQEQGLIADYYALSEEAQALEYYSPAYFDTYAEPMAQVLVDLIHVRQNIASYTGYGNYPAFAYDNYYERDYNRGQVDRYLDASEKELAPIYASLEETDLWDAGNRFCSEQEVFEYVQQAAREMGGVTWEAFRLLEAGELYDIGVGENKSGLSFELFLEAYYQPYVFLSGTGTAYDRLTFAHEFGHFAMDYAAAGSYAGIDVLEIFSQGMEYLSLSYSDAGEALADLKLLDSLAIYVEQAAYAEFEHRMYELQGQDLNTASLFALYEEVCRSYGFGGESWDPRDFVTTLHFYEQPLYIISYVVSNDAAMQLYELEQQTPGAGKTCFEENLATEEYEFLSFLESAGLQSPFDPQRIQTVRELFAARFGV